MSIDPHEIPCNLVQQIQLECKIAVATPVLIQKINVLGNADETLT
jgi:hypothetical protein